VIPVVPVLQVYEVFRDSQEIPDHLAQPEFSVQQGTAVLLQIRGVLDQQEKEDLQEMLVQAVILDRKDHRGATG
jgi:hypothetical protein